MVGRIHDFFAVALAAQGWALRKSAVGLFQVVDQTGTAVARFTDDRERAMATDGLGLLGLDHPWSPVSWQSGGTHRPNA